MDYSDNVALLFHCTRGKVDDILSQGLDERLGSCTGLLGRGIYFADDPLKSTNYDYNSTLLVFAVFLGDCLNVDHIVNKQQFVREPAKTNEQKRNHSDLFFDSIVGRPAGVNEYVIYNRYQCCPLYTVAYSKIGMSGHGQDSLAKVRGVSPPFAWTTKNRKGNGAMPPKEVTSWPFFAQTIFELMEGDQMKPVVAPTQNGQGDAPPPPSKETDESIAIKLSTLTELGFADDNVNVEILKKYNYDLEATINALLTGITSTPNSAVPNGKRASAEDSTAPSAANGLKKVKIEATVEAAAPEPNGTVTPQVDLREMINYYDLEDESFEQADLDAYIDGSAGNASNASTTPAAAAATNEDVDEECPICCTEFPTGPADWKVTFFLILSQIFKIKV